MPNIDAGRAAVEAYRQAHQAMHAAGEASDAGHDALLNALLADLRSCGYDSLAGFFEADQIARDEDTLAAVRASLEGTVLSLRIVHEADARLWMAELEKPESDVLLVAESPDHVFLGAHADETANVDRVACDAAGVPIVRSRFVGRGYRYCQGDALFVVLKTEQKVPELALGRVVCEVGKILGHDTAWIDNDVRVGDRRIAMTAPPLKAEGTWLLCAEVLLQGLSPDASLLMRYPPDKWAGKLVSRIEDWLKPLLVSQQIVVDALVQTMESTLGVEVRR